MVWYSCKNKLYPAVLPLSLFSVYEDYEGIQIAEGSCKWMCLEATCSLILCRGRVSLKFTYDESQQLHTKCASKPQQCVLTKDIESFTSCNVFFENETYCKYASHIIMYKQWQAQWRWSTFLTTSQAMRRMIDHTYILPRIARPLMKSSPCSFFVLETN